MVYINCGAQKRLTSHLGFILVNMLNNMDLNSQDSFYLQFENSSLGREANGEKDNQDMFVDADSAAPAPFATGQFTTAV